MSILTKKEFNEFNGQSYDKGVLTLNLNSWNEFYSVVRVFNNETDYIWRGQCCYHEEILTTKGKEEWRLRSTFDREFSKEKDRNKELDKILNVFKKRLKDLPNIHGIDFSKDKDDTIWAIGQHYGLSTPLLDWTERPYIAAYFAFYKKNKKQTDKRVVYALNKVIKRLILKEKDAKTKEVLSRQRKVEFDFDISNFAPEHHQRFINQKGAFTKAFKGDDIKSIVKDFWERTRNKNGNRNEILLTEIVIPNKFQGECLAALRAMNITHGTLFPDYAGAVEICKIDLTDGFS